jgi:hypothetical protein
LARASAVSGPAQKGADGDVVKHRHRDEGQRHLEGAGNAYGARASGAKAVTSRPGNARCRWWGKIASQTIEERRFAGAIGTDQAQHVAAIDSNRGIIHRLEGPKSLGDVARIKQHAALRL